MYNDFFKVIDTEEKAYWLGFIYADGCVTKNDKCLILELSAKDYDHIVKFQNAIKSTHNIKLYARNNYKYARLTIGCKEMVLDLKQKGCISHKSLLLVFPFCHIPDELISHFIRGYYDGDGCLSVTSNIKGTKKRTDYTLSFLGTKEMLDGINKYLPINMPIKKEMRIYRMRNQSKKVINDILSFLYQDASVYLERKYKKYIEYIKCA